MMTLLSTSTGKLRLWAGQLARFTSPDQSVPGPTPVAQGTITVTNERQSRWIYQRVGLSKSVSVTGTCTAPPGTLVEARAVDEVTGNPIQSWIPIATVLGNGAYAGDLIVPQGLWYRRQVRIANSTTAIATEANSFGIGIGIVELGQSNMANMRSTPDRYPLGHPAAYEYKGPNSMGRVGNISKKNASGADIYPPNTLISAANVVGGYTDYLNHTAGGGTSSDGYVYVPNLVAEASGLPVFVLNVAVGGTSIESYWKSGQTGWTNLVNTLNSIGGDCEMCLLMQGENNAGMAGSTYQGHLTGLLTQFHLQTGRNANTFRFGVISLGPTSTGAGGYAGTDPISFGKIRVAQRDWAYNTPGAFYVGGAHDIDLTGSSDNVHITGVGFNTLGRRYGKSASAALGFGTTSAGPKMVSASFVHTTTIRVTVQHTGGTALQDGVGGAGQSLRGFLLTDGSGANVPIIATLIVSATQVELSVASAPVGPCTLSYAMQNSPYTTNPNDVKSGYSPAAVLRDNAAYYSTYRTNTDNPLGSPMQPCAAITVSAGG